MSADSKIVIIRGSAPNIATATKLCENYIENLTILDVENRIASRIHSRKIENTAFDLGGHCVQNKKENIVNEMVNNLFLLRPSLTTCDNLTFYRSEDFSIDKQMLNKLFKIVMDTLLNKDVETECHGNIFKIKYCEEIHLEFSENQILQIANQMQDFFDKHYHQCGSISWPDFLKNEEFDVIRRNILNPKPRIPIKEKILLNKKQSDDISSSQQQITIKCIDKSSCTADHVIISVSVGVLKENITEWFKPALLPFTIKSFNRMSMGACNKIFLNFTKKRWPSNVKKFTCIWNKDDIQQLRNEVWNHEPIISVTFSLENIPAFYTVDHNLKILQVWITQKWASDVVQLSDNVIINSCVRLLRKFVCKKYHISEPYSILSEASDFSTLCGPLESGYKETERVINTYKQPVHKEIIIIGAGFAGLGAAWTFKNHGFDDFLIIEASGRPGGRVHTIYVDNKPIELGAQWIHGKSNAMYDIAFSNGLIANELTVEGSGIYVRSDGVIFDKYLVQKIDSEMSLILEKCRKLRYQGSYPKSFGDYLDTEFKKLLNSIDSKDREMAKQLYDWHVRFHIIDLGCQNLNAVSAKYFGAYLRTDQNAYYNFKTGYQSLIDIFVQKIEEQKFVFNSPVISIDRNKSSIIIKTGSGKLFSCNHLILTPSLNVLRDLSSIIPKSVIQSFDNMGNYGIGKLFLIFSDRWWGDLQGFQLLWQSSNDDLEDSEKWLRTIPGFETLLSHPNVLMGMVGGEGLEAMEALDEEVIGKMCVKLLSRFVPDFNIPQPRKVIRSKWLSNKWTRGTYSHVSVNSDTSTSHYTDLARPIYIDGVPRILLAGEATHSHFYSTTHGAFESGQKQSTFLYNYINNKCNPQYYKFVKG